MVKKLEREEAKKNMNIEWEGFWVWGNNNNKNKKASACEGMHGKEGCKNNNN